MKNLTPREKRFVKSKIEGKNNLQAYKEAGYSLKGEEKGILVNASKINSKPHIQAAIDKALEEEGMSPLWAVKELKKVAAQDDELGAKRLAIKDSLELMGWNKSDRPTITLDINNAFFGGARGLQSRQENEES